MSDKMRPTYPISVTFGNGEQPSSTKLNAINDQAKNGLALIERAVGDPWNQSGDSLLIDYPLRIPNLARVIGDQQHLNSRFPNPNMGDSDTVYIQQDLTEFVGQTKILLDFKPEAGATINASVAALENASAATYEAAPESLLTDVDLPAEWFLDTAEGILYLGAPLGSGGGTTIEYEVVKTNLTSDGPDEYAVNVVPPVDQISGHWDGIKIVQRSAGKYLLVLPPRRPTDQLATGLGKVPQIGISHPWDNTTLVGGSKDYYWYIAPGTDTNSWDDPGQPKNATIRLDANRFSFVQSARYRFQLSELLEDFIVNGAAGASLPSGALYLWDNTNKTTIEGLTFRIPEANDLYGASWGSRPGWVIQVEGSTLDSIFSGFTSTDNTDDPADYKSRFSMITAGNSLASAIDNIRYHQLTQLHNPSCLSKPIDHGSLKNTQPVEGTRGYSALPTPYRSGDDHAGYLSREGSTATGTLTRDVYNNAMMGDFLLASTTSGSNYQNQTADSQRVVFGAMGATAPELYSRYVSPGTTIQFQGTSETYNNFLSLKNQPLLLEHGVLAFRGHGGSFNDDFYGIVHDDQVGWGWFNFVSNDRVDLSGMSTGEIFVLGSSQDIHLTSRPTDSDWTGQNGSTWINLSSTTGAGGNRIEFKGNRLDLSAESGDLNDVVVGWSNSSTYLRLENEVLQLGADSGTQVGITRNGNNLFHWKDAASVTAPTIAETSGVSFYTGTLHAEDGDVYFKRTGGGALDHRRIELNNTSFFRFVDGSTNTKAISAGNLLLYGGSILSGEGNSISGGDPIAFNAIPGPTLVISDQSGNSADLSLEGDVQAGSFTLDGTKTKTLVLPHTPSLVDANDFYLTTHSGSQNFGSRYIVNIGSGTSTIYFPLNLPASATITDIHMSFTTDGSSPSTYRWRGLITTYNVSTGVMTSAGSGDSNYSSSWSGAGTRYHSLSFPGSPDFSAFTGPWYMGVQIDHVGGGTGSDNFYMGPISVEYTYSELLL